SGHGFILVFSLTQESSLEEVDRLRRAIYRIKGRIQVLQVPIVVVGTQSDRAAQRDVPPHTIEHMSNLWKIPFYVTSAKTNSHVNDAFEGLIRQMRLKYLPGMTGTEELKKRRDNASCGIM
ncbi:P-loop containing nucleoside triphosphate hydrolase protein, partial [Mycena crocata]